MAVDAAAGGGIQCRCAARYGRHADSAGKLPCSVTLLLGGGGVLASEVWWKARLSSPWSASRSIQWSETGMKDPPRGPPGSALLLCI